MKPHHTSSTMGTSASSGDGVRRRTSKACDRCRLKKTKCDGAIRCLKCQADDAICIYGERKKVHDKVYPKGYAQLLEQQQGWLVNGIQKLYRCMQTGEGWPADPLKHGANRHPLTHDILTALGVLDPDRRLRREEYGAVQQGFGKHVDECTQPSKFSHNPHSCTPIQLLPMPHDLTVSSPEHQVEGPITDPDLTISGTQKFDTTGIDDPLQLFPNSSSYTFGETSSTTHDDSLVNIFNNDLQMRSSISYFSESNCTSTDSGNVTDCLDPPRDTSIVETWPMWTEPFWGPFHSQDFCSESFVQ